MTVVHFSTGEAKNHQLPEALILAMHLIVTSVPTAPGTSERSTNWALDVKSNTNNTKNIFTSIFSYFTDAARCSVAKRGEVWCLWEQIGNVSLVQFYKLESRGVVLRNVVWLRTQKTSHFQQNFKPISLHYKRKFPSVAYLCKLAPLAKFKCSPFLQF